MRAILAVLFTAATVFGADTAAPTQQQIDDIIQKFAAKEAEFAKAREAYTYRQSAKIQELDEGGNVQGRWEMVSDVVFSSDGKRTEKVIRAPVQNLKNIIMTPEDEQDLRSIQPFVLTTNELSKYFIRYLGRETLDEIGCYSFAVKPRKMESGQRYFEGIVWVDDRDLQIVKSYGRGVGQQKRGSDQAFPKFETFREQIDGKFWFPTYTIANDTLNFKSGLSQRIRQSVKYEDYKQFKASSTIKFGDEAGDDKTKKPESKKPEPKKP